MTGEADSGEAAAARDARAPTGLEAETDGTGRAGAREDPAPGAADTLELAAHLAVILRAVALVAEQNHTEASSDGSPGNTGNTGSSGSSGNPGNPGSSGSGVASASGGDGIRGNASEAGAHRPKMDNARGMDRLLIDAISGCERLKGSLAAVQARLGAVFDESQRDQQREAGLPDDRIGLGIGDQLALARNESPHLGKRHLGMARILVREMPHTLAALSRGEMNEDRAQIMVRETACLTLEDRRTVDREIAGNPDGFRGKGDRELTAVVKALAARLDPVSVTRRAARAESERRVTCRPAPDTMAYVTALVPVAQGVGMMAGLAREADSLRGQGDPRSRGQIMADTMVRRVTGQEHAGSMRVEVQLVMTDRTLLAGDSEPAHLQGYGVVPAQWARDLVRMGTGDLEPGQAEVEAIVRRLYTEPTSGALLAMDSRARLFPEGMQRFIAVRDQACRTLWCGAPIRNFDHIVPFARGGLTEPHNGAGLCEACNQAKEAPGWSVEPMESGSGSGRHATTTTTPTGHRYVSVAPKLPGTDPPPIPGEGAQGTAAGSGGSAFPGGGGAGPP